jgi:class 3 adenylate cyclase/tetratricopeptide (TPR) repeat protein
MAVFSIVILTAESVLAAEVEGNRPYDLVVTCADCGSENRPDSIFCAECGAALGRTCPTCGTKIDAAFSFCPSCGASVTTPRLQRPRVAEERKVVTVVFADLVGFTARAERLDPEDVRAVLAPYHAHLKRELERHGGSVEKFIGDAVMAVFGAPTAHEDDPERAVRAAVAIRDWVIGKGQGLQVRIAVNTGEALVALDARPAEGEAMLVGDVVNTASRMQAAAAVNGILVGEATYRATRHVVLYHGCEPLHARGKAEPVPVWQVVRALDPAEASETRTDRPLVGRRDELSVLQDALVRAGREREPQFVTVLGVPGIGKSRLVLEFLSSSQGDDPRTVWLLGRSVAYGEGVTFSALAEMVKSASQIRQTDSADVAATKLHSAISEMLVDAGEARWLEERLRPLVGLASPEELRGARRGEAFAAWTLFFHARAEQPLILVFEDLHWADDAQLDFVDHLVERSTGYPLTIVVTARPELYERRPAWGGGKRNSFTISLSPLSDADTDLLVAGLLNTPTLPTDTRVALGSRVGGNPLFAGEFVRMLVERGHFQRTEDGWTIAGSELPVPDSVQAIVAARLDALTPQEKSLLHDAAVIGDVFSADGLAALGGGSPSSTETLLLALERKEFIRRERGAAVSTDPLWSFHHALIRDVAYGQVARRRRAERHELAAGWVESLAADRGEDQAETIAHHYLRALEYAQAAGGDTTALAARTRLALGDAGDRASALLAHAAAARFYAGALALSSPDDPTRPDLLFRLGRARFHSEQRGGEELLEARELLLSAGDPETAAEASVLLFALLTAEGHRAAARVHLNWASAALAQSGPSRAKAHVLAALSRSTMTPGNEDEAIRVGREALSTAQESGLEELRANILGNVGFARLLRGDLGGMADLEQSLEVALASNSPESVRAYRLLGAAHSMLGGLARSFELYALAREAGERFEDQFNIRWLVALGVVEAYWRGHWHEAQPLAARFIAESGSGAHHYLEAVCRYVRGEILLARGGVDAACEDAEKGLAFARRAGEAWLVDPALAFAARAYGAAGQPRGEEFATELLALWSTRLELASYWTADLAVALEEAGRGSELLAIAARIEQPTRWLEAARSYALGEPGCAADCFERIGSLPDEAFARLRAGEIHLTAGRADEARSQLERAYAFFDGVGADAYAARARAALGR